MLILAFQRSEPRIDAVIGGVAGLASGVLGVGGGFLMVPLQVMWGHSDQRRASGTSLAAIVSIAFAGAVVYYFAKGAPQVDLTVAFFLVLGSAIGAFAGARLARKVSERALKILVAILLLVVGFKELHDGVLGDSSFLRGSAGTTLDLERDLPITISGLIIGDPKWSDRRRWRHLPGAGNGPRIRQQSAGRSGHFTSRHTADSGGWGDNASPQRECRYASGWLDSHRWRSGSFSGFLAGFRVAGPGASGSLRPFPCCLRQLGYGRDEAR